MDLWQGGVARGGELFDEYGLYLPDANDVILPLNDGSRMRYGDSLYLWLAAWRHSLTASAFGTGGNKHL